MSQPIHKTLEKKELKDSFQEHQNPNTLTEEVEENTVPTPTSAASILAGLKTSKSPEFAPKITATSLGNLWLKEVSKLTTTHGCLPALSMKDKGHFGKLAKLWGDKAPNIIAHVVRNWSTYATYVEQAKGLKARPLRPYLGFLYTYHYDALVFYTERTVQPIAQTETKPVPAVTATPKYKSTEQPMTKEELLQLLGE